ncbi:MAG TPA: hypothetical protein VFV73_22035 [Streptosporangiaceae bacterium]|nr:hypothetical protein [Streptosporangiaceae bacterium]
MTGGEAARPRGQRGAKAAVPPCLTVAVGWGDDAGQVFRVDAPDRVLRVWALLGNAADDLRQAALPPEVLSQIDDAAARTGRRGRTYASNQRRPAPRCWSWERAGLPSSRGSRRWPWARWLGRPASALWPDHLHERRRRRDQRVDPQAW